MVSSIFKSGGASKGARSIAVDDLSTHVGGQAPIHCHLILQEHTLRQKPIGYNRFDFRCAEIHLSLSRHFGREGPQPITQPGYQTISTSLGREKRLINDGWAILIVTDMLMVSTFTTMSPL